MQIMVIHNFTKSASNYDVSLGHQLAKQKTPPRGKLMKTSQSGVLPVCSGLYNSCQTV